MSFPSPIKTIISVSCTSTFFIEGILQYAHCRLIYINPSIKNVLSKPLHLRESTHVFFLGYPSNHRGYKCYDLSYGKIIISRHVIFYETQFPFAKLHTPHIQTYDFLDDGPNPYVVHHLVSQSTTPNAQTPGLVPDRKSVV